MTLVIPFLQGQEVLFDLNQIAFTFGSVKIISFNSQNIILPILYNQICDASNFSFGYINIKIIFFSFSLIFSPHFHREINPTMPNHHLNPLQNPLTQYTIWKPYTNQNNVDQPQPKLQTQQKPTTVI